MGTYFRKQKTVEAYQFTGDESAPGWPEGWLDQVPAFPVEIDVPESMSTPTSAMKGAMVSSENQVSQLTPLPRLFTDDEPGQQKLTIAGLCMLHQAAAGDWVVRQPSTGEYFTLSDIGFRSIYEEKS
jgi:hypothetical protein